MPDASRRADASRRGRQLGIADGETGSVTFPQRLGGALNGDPHAHCIVPHGLFVLHTDTTRRSDPVTSALGGGPPGAADDLGGWSPPAACRMLLPW